MNICQINNQLRLYLRKSKKMEFGAELSEFERELTICRN